VNRPRAQIVDRADSTSADTIPIIGPDLVRRRYEDPRNDHELPPEGVHHLLVVRRSRTRSRRSCPTRRIDSVAVAGLTEFLLIAQTVTLLSIGSDRHSRRLDGCGGTEVRNLATPHYITSVRIQQQIRQSNVLIESVETVGQLGCSRSGQT